jgi:stalled ribosome alternative rescue factor ArfA
MVKKELERVKRVAIEFKKRGKGEYARRAEKRYTLMKTEVDEVELGT